ncbi:MAG: hypothetical protein AAF628_01720 [Planctomycetota bacterium]
MPHRVCSSLIALLTAATAHAQTTWIVAEGGGPGVEFRRIQDALDEAADGDTIVVRAGSYPEFRLSTSKGVLIAGEPGAIVGTAGGVFFEVTDLVAGRTFSMRNLSFTAGATQILFQDCAGQVYVEKVDVFQATVSNSFAINNCAQISLTQVATTGLPAMRVTNSKVVFADCRIRATPWLTTFPALTVTNSETTMVDGLFAGGSSSFATPPAAAIHMSGGTLTLAGRNTSVTAGSPGTPTPTPAVLATGGEVFIDPAVTLVSQGGAAPISGGAAVTRGPIASVRADGLQSQGTWQLDLHAPTGSPFCLFASLPRPALASPWGAVWFDLRLHAVLACGAVGPNDQFQMSVPLPMLPRAVPLVAQAAVVTPVGPQISTPSVDIVE